MNKFSNILFFAISIFLGIYIVCLSWLSQIKIDTQNVEKRISTSFSFPLEATKTDLETKSEYKNQRSVWAKSISKSNHHDYKSADLHVPPGTKVLAAKAGKIVKINRISRCDNNNFPYIIIEGIDGLSYLYSHLSSNLNKIKEGELVERSTVIGTVGGAKCAQNTTPHLHFDITRNRWLSDTSFGKKYLMIDPQPVLRKSFEEELSDN